MHLTTAPPQGTTKHYLKTMPPWGATKRDLTTAPPRGATMISHLCHLRAPPCISQLHHLGAPPSMISTTPPRGTTKRNLTTAPPRGTTMLSQPCHLRAPPRSHNCATSGHQATSGRCGNLHIYVTSGDHSNHRCTTTANSPSVPYHHDHLDPATIGSR